VKVKRYPKWFMPAYSLGLGVACLAAFWIGGDRRQGLYSLALMGGLAAVFLLGGRNETIRALRGDGRDEYWQGLDNGATLIAGLVLIVAVIGMAMWEWAHGRNGTPYVQLCALAGVAYIGALVALRLRR
jgi:hypothetical protein